jgi:outer membrane biosynthesis protein TonB
MFRSLALGLALAALLLAGCGSDNPRMIDQQRARALTATVDEIGQRTDSEDCDGAQSAVQEAKNQVQELPSKVSVGLKDNLNDWLDHIDEQVPKDCKAAAEETPTPTETPDETETPTPTPTPDETPTPTPTPSATPTETPPPEPTVEPPADPGDTGGVLPGDEG